MDQVQTVKENSKLSCVKCGGTDFSTAQISTAGGVISRLFNFQYKRFNALSCTSCGYTEFYKAGSSTWANIADILAGG